ncbi:MAG: stage III sporulation protein AC [Clostridia bacterium]|nr:stage III sporulation protein AC [Clostridia bacterium]
MDTGLIFKIAAVGIIVAFLNQLLSRANKEEYAMVTTIAGLIAVLLMLIPQISELFASVKELVEL